MDRIENFQIANRESWRRNAVISPELGMRLCMHTDSVSGRERPSGGENAHSKF